MKRLIAFLFSLSIVACLSGVPGYAQGKGLGQGPAVNQGHGQTGAHEDAKTRSVDHAGNADSHDAKAGWEAKLNNLIQSDPAFGARIQSLLPAGADIKAAESGFKNQGQFIAALHVSKNLDIPFDQLKAKMTGATASTGQNSSTTKSLGQAIHELRPSIPDTQANEEAKKAEQQAKLTEKSKTTA